MDLSLHNPVEMVAKLANDDLDPLVLRRCAPLTQQLQNPNVMHFLILNAAFIPSPMPCRRWGAGDFFALQKPAIPDIKKKSALHVHGLTWAAFCALTLVRLPSPIFKATSGLWIGQVLSKHNVQFAYLHKLQFLIFNVAIISVPTPGRRWRAGAFFALLKSAMPDYKYQEKAAPHARGLIRNVLPSVVALTGDS